MEQLSHPLLIQIVLLAPFLVFQLIQDAKDGAHLPVEITGLLRVSKVGQGAGE